MGRGRRDFKEKRNKTFQRNELGKWYKRKPTNQPGEDDTTKVIGKKKYTNV